MLDLEKKDIRKRFARVRNKPFYGRFGQLLRVRRVNLARLNLAAGLNTNSENKCSFQKTDFPQAANFSYFDICYFAYVNMLAKRTAVLST